MKAAASGCSSGLRRALLARAGLVIASLCASPAAVPAATTTYTSPWSGGTINAGDTVVLDNGASVTGNVVANGTLQFNQTAALTMSGTLSGSGGLTLANSGTLVLTGLSSGAARFDLAISAAAGRLMIGGSGANPLMVGASGTGSLAVAGGWVSSGTGFLGLSPGSVGTATISSGSWTNSRFLFVGASGSGSLDVTGGQVTNTTGIVGFNGGAGAATVSGGRWANSGALHVGGYTTGTAPGTGSLALSGGQVTGQSGYIGSNAGSVGAVTVTGGTWTNSSTLYVGNSGSGTLRISGGRVSSTVGPFGVAGVIGNNASGLGTVVVTGGTWANTGSLLVGSAGTGTLTISGSGGTGGVVVVGGTLSKGALGTIDLAAGGTLQIGSGSASGALATDVVANGVLVFNRTGSSVVSTVISGTGSLLILGGGTFTFTNANTYSGPTSVGAGALVVAGSLGMTAVSVSPGAMLGGSGTIDGPVTIGGGTLAPGPGLESLATGALAFLDAATFACDVQSSGTASADLVIVAGGLSLSGTVGLSLTDVAASPVPFGDGTTLSLIDYTGDWNGGLFTWDGAALPDGGVFAFAGRPWMIDYDAPFGGTNFSGDHLPGSRFVNITAVPEPAAWALLTAGVVCCGCVRRRKRAPGPQRALHGFTMLEVLVASAIIGGLMALLLPAVQGARESARRVHCLNNLRQIGVGFHNFHAARDCFPTAVSGRGARHYWTAQILPYLDDNPLAGIYDFAVACNDIRNRDAVQTRVAFMGCPSAPSGPRQDVKFIKVGSPTWPASAADYAGSAGPSNALWNAPAVVSSPKPASIDGFFNGTINPGEKGRRIRDITDGSAKSIAVLESVGRPQMWTFGELVPDSGLATSPAARYVSLCGWADANQFVVRGFRLDPAQADPAARCRSPGPQMINGSNNLGIYAGHPGGADVLFADGSACFLDDSTSADVMAALLTIRGGDAAVRR